MKRVYPWHKKYFLSFSCVFLIVSLPVCFAVQLNLTYDRNGNLITGDGKFREYNEFNQLIRIRNGSSISGQIVEEYLYHPIEDRILAKRVYDPTGLSQVEVVIYPNDNIVRTISYPQANAINISDKIYIKDESGLVAEFNPNQSRLYYTNDHLGSTSTITNSSGALVEQTFYEPFGAIISGGNKSRFYYEDKDYSQKTQEYDFNFRKYNPDLHFFTKPDEMISDVYDPQNLNRYSFEKNNPYKNIDPDGKNTLMIVGIAGFILGSLYYISNTPVNEKNSRWIRVEKAYAMGGVGLSFAILTYGFIRSGGSLRIAAAGSSLSARGQAAIVGASFEMAREVIAQENDMDISQIISNGIASSIVSPRTFGGGQFVGLKKSSSFLGNSLFTPQSMLALSYMVYSETLSNIFNPIILNAVNLISTGSVSNKNENNIGTGYSSGNDTNLVCSYNDPNILYDKNNQGISMDSSIAKKRLENQLRK